MGIRIGAEGVGESKGNFQKNLRIAMQYREIYTTFPVTFLVCLVEDMNHFDGSERACGFRAFCSDRQLSDFEETFSG